MTKSNKLLQIVTLRHNTDFAFFFNSVLTTCFSALCDLSLSTGYSFSHIIRFQSTSLQCLEQRYKTGRPQAFCQKSMLLSL